MEYENKILIYTEDAPDGGVCEQCGASAEQLFRVTISKGSVSNTRSLCASCTAAAKRYAARKNQEAALQNAPSPVRPAPIPLTLDVRQSDAPAQPPVGSPAPAPTKKTNKTLPLVLLIVCVAVIIIAAAVGIGLSGDKDSDDKSAVKRKTTVAAQIEKTEKESAPTAAPAPTTAPVPPDEDVPDALIQKLSSVLIVDDAAYEYYNFSKNTADRYARAVSSAADSLKGTARVFDIVVPTSMDITLSDPVRQRISTGDQKQATDYIYGALSSNCISVNAYDTLRAHRKEYVYFRTDHHWTALGAYYAYCEYTAKAGLRTAQLDEFTERQFDNFVGAFYNDSGKNKALEKNPDTVYAYEPKATNDMTFTDKSGKEIKWNIVTDVSSWNRGSRYNTFIGGDNPYSYISNPGVTDGSSCVVVKESFGNAFVPFLLANYSEIHVIDYRYWNGKLEQFVRRTGVQDVIYLNNISATRNATLVKNLESIS